jgi:phytoene dehydrogenase-like protein
MIAGLTLAAATGCESDDENPIEEPEECTPAEDGGSSSARKKLSCPVAIIGGGAGGLHTAYRLGDELGEDVCLFEKEARLGGRIYDVSKDGKADSPRIGVGARRIMETQEVVFALADELGIEYAMPTEYEDLFVARGATGFSSDELNAQAYPTLPDDADYETSLYDKLLSLDGIDKYSDFQAYARATVGAEGFEFLHDMSRFRADFRRRSMHAATWTTSWKSGTPVATTAIPKVA